MNTYINTEVCSKCKGRCCKSMGCHFAPSDFKDLTFEGLKKEIDKGYISIDWWEGNPFDEDSDDISRACYLRMRNKNSDIIDASWGGECILLTETGCPLSFEDRPKGGRELIPNSSHYCTEGYSKNDASQEWYKYADILESLIDHYSDYIY